MAGYVVPGVGWQGPAEGLRLCLGRLARAGERPMAPSVRVCLLRLAKVGERSLYAA